MRLLELTIKPSGIGGWGSEVLRFGADITQLYGPNGCGKTPVIHSIAYAMGYPVKYRDDILHNCEAVSLKAVHKDTEILFERIISDRFHIQVTLPDEDAPKIFYNEYDMSQFLFGFLGLTTLALTSTSSQPTQPYISTFLPLFYVDQDSGYTNAYKAPSAFIKDQYAEMVRMSLGVPPKNSYERKKLLIEKKEHLKSIDFAIVNSEKLIDRLVKDVPGVIRTSHQLDVELGRLKDQLDELRSGQDTVGSVDSAIKNLMSEKANEKREIDFRIRELDDRISGFSKIKNEIEVEINTLSLNEESRRLFASFKDICANASCQLFLSSSESYGKNLLYLKDQIKDLDRNTKYQEIRLDELKARSQKLDAELDSLRESLTKNSSDNSTDALIATISRLTREIIDIQGEKDLVDRIASEKSAYVDLLNQREKLHNDIASMDSGGSGSDLRVLEFRSAFKARLASWLDVLSTKNVSRDISVDSDFNVLFGAEKLSQFSGSTLLRVVLSMKAAFFEIYISRGAPSIEFMIFDTPKQHDIESEHFAAFIRKLKGLVADNNQQIIFSTTEYRYQVEEGDVEWMPSFPGKEQNMFLG